MITVIEPYFYWPETTLSMFPFLMEHIERCGRVCYKSEDRITPGSAERFISTICRNRHESVLEHCSVTAIVVCSRACSHQLVRHRIAAYSQESMRYVNYGKHDSLKVICPESIGLEPGDYHTMYQENCDTNTSLRLAWKNGILLEEGARQIDWAIQIDNAYNEYKSELVGGVKPEDARYVLPNATKTELAVTFNLRMWRHIFEMRALNKHAQWEIRGIFSNILDDLKERLPAVFCDLEEDNG